MSNIHAGTDMGIHAIAPVATVKINYRSHDGAVLEELHRRIFQAVQEACDEETARWGKDTITWDCVKYVDIPAGGQDAHAPLVESAFLAAKAVSEDPSIVKLLNGGAVNGNMSIARGLPCVTLGEGPRENNVHNLNESFDPDGSWRLPQEILLTLLLAAGIDGETDSVLA